MSLMDWIFGKQSTAPATPSPRPVQERPAPPPALRFSEYRSFETEAVGESHYQSALSSICGEKTTEGHKLECDALLVPEPSNKYDPNAVRVEIRGKLVAYLSRRDATHFHAELARQGHSHRAVFCRAKIVGGWRVDEYDQGDFGVRLKLPADGAWDL